MAHALRSSAAASMSAGASKSFAPLTIKILFWPLSSTKIDAMPLDASGAFVT